MYEWWVDSDALAFSVRQSNKYFPVNVWLKRLLGCAWTFLQSLKHANFYKCIFYFILLQKGLLAGCQIQVQIRNQASMVDYVYNSRTGLCSGADLWLKRWPLHPVKLNYLTFFEAKHSSEFCARRLPDGCASLVLQAQKQPGMLCCILLAGWDCSSARNRGALIALQW